MTKVRATLGVLLALVCVLGLLLTPGVAWASHGTTQEGNVKCPSDKSSFTINGNPGNGTFSDGTVSITITNSDNDSFNWSATLSLDAVLVKGGNFTEVNPGGTSGFAESAFNESSGQNYGISHVTFCYSTGGGTRSPSPTPTPTPTPTRTPTPTPTPTVRGSDVCPPNSDFPNMPTDDIKDCFRDDVGGEVIRRPSEPKDRVLPNVIRNNARPRAETAPRTEAETAVLPFTGAGGILAFAAISLGLIGGGMLGLRARRSRHRG